MMDQNNLHRTQLCRDLATALVIAQQDGFGIEAAFDRLFAKVAPVPRGFDTALRKRRIRIDSHFPGLQARHDLVDGPNICRPYGGGESIGGRIG